MWIKWKYNDHGHPDFKELEVPDDVVKSYGSVENYICEEGLVPTWSERFLSCRIKWEKIKAPRIETLKSEIAKLKEGISWRRKKMAQLKKLIE